VGALYLSGLDQFDGREAKDVLHEFGDGIPSDPEELDLSVVDEVQTMRLEEA
jgi:hypothetical protein